MGAMEITTWGHAAVRFTRDGHRLVIDPGVLSDQAVMEEAQAVLITHEHADHVVPDTLTAALTASTDLEVWAPAAVVAQLTEAGAPAERVPRGRRRGRVHRRGLRRPGPRPRPCRRPSLTPARRQRGLSRRGARLHPGDSFTLAPNGQAVQMLLLPISVPWLKLAESVDYAREVGPTVTIPIHDAILSEAGRAITDRIFTTLAPEVGYRRLAPGEPLSLTI